MVKSFVDICTWVLPDTQVCCLWVFFFCWCRSGMRGTRTQSNGLWNTQMLSSTWWAESGKQGREQNHALKQMTCIILFTCSCNFKMPFVAILEWMFVLRKQVIFFPLCFVTETMASRMSLWPSPSKLQRQPEKPASPSLSTFLTWMLTYAAHPNTWGTRYLTFCPYEPQLTLTQPMSLLHTMFL